jgi:Zn ribbon nucleic-acid-binding protein/transposase-like protein
MGRPGYPKNVREFRQQFSNPEDCLKYLTRSRWPEGFICPKCSGKSAWLNSKRYVFECRECGRQTSPTAGTLMHRSHVPIQEWFWAAYLVATHTPGISAVQLQRQLGISSDTTAWHMLHRLRNGMVNENRTHLAGLIEADESVIGGPAKGKQGRGSTAAKHKSLIIGGVEVVVYKDKKGNRRERAGRLRLSTLEDAGAVSIRDFLTHNVETGSTLRTDGWRGYSDGALVGYKHRVRVVRTPERAHRVAPHIHRVFSNLKAWLNGTHHGVEPKYLQTYLDEFVFRFNRRQTPMAAFQTLLGISTSKSPLTLRELANRSQP